MIESKRAKLYILSVLGAMEVIIVFSALGSIQIGGASITFANLPILAAAMLFGPLESTALGLIFGLTSLWKASSFYAVGIDALLSPLRSGNPLYSFIVTIGTRALLGLFAGLVYRIVSKKLQDRSRIVVVFSSISMLLYYVLFYGSIKLFFNASPVYRENVMATILGFALNLLVAVITLDLLIRWMTSEKMILLLESIAEKNSLKILNKKLKFYITIILAISVVVACTLLFMEFFSKTGIYFNGHVGEYRYYLITGIQFYIAIILAIFILAIVVRYYAFYTLVESERNMMLINMMPGGISIIEAEGDNLRILFASEGLKELLGFDDNYKMELSGKNPIDYTHPDDVDTLMELIKQQKDSDGGFEATYRLLNHKKGYCWVTFRIYLKERMGNKLRLYGIIIDADNQVRRQDELQKRYTETKAITDLMAVESDIIFYINLSKDRVRLEKNNTDYDISWAEDLIYVEELFKKASERNTNVDSMLNYQKNFNREGLLEAFEHGKTNVSFEHNFIFSNKLIKWVETSIIMTCNPDNNDIEGFLYVKDKDEEKTAKDITDRILASDYEFIELINIEDDSTKLYISGNAELHEPKLDDLTYTEILEHHLCQLVGESDAEEIKRKLSIATIVKELEKKNIYSCSFSVNIPRGECRKMFQFQYLDKYRKHILFTQSDITDVYVEGRYKADVLKDAVKAAEEANKAREEFATKVSHDIRTPLNAIMGLSELALQEEDINKVRSYLSGIAMSGESLIKLANDIIDKDSEDKEHAEIFLTATTLTSCLSDVFAMVKSQMEYKNLNFIYTPGKYTDREVIMDKGKVRQIIVNILSNSVKFTPSQGTIEFTVEQDETDTGEIFTRFIIKDTGIGMSEDFIARAFEPFVSGSEAVDEEESAGLGLSIVKKLVDLMGGTVHLSSKKNVGTETRVELAFAKKDYDSLRNDETDNSSFDLAGKRVLVAEDNAINQEMAVILLEKEGMIVETADNGLRAVEAVVDNPDEHGYDAILMDIEMPILDGIKAAKSIRSIGTEYTQNIPIIAMTANAFEHDIRKSLEAGMNGHISKPVAASELYRVLDREIKKNGEGRK